MMSTCQISDFYVDLSDIMSTCQIMLLLSVCQKPAQTPAHEFTNKDIIQFHVELPWIVSNLYGYGD